MNKYKSYTNILSVPISNTSYIKTLKAIKNNIESKTKIYICVAAVHLVMECQKNPYLLSGVKNAAIVTPDGMPLVWLSKLYGNKEAARVYGPNLTLMIAALCEQKKYRLFLLGGSQRQSQDLQKILNIKYPKLKVVGAMDTPIRPIPSTKNKIIINQINNSKADIVLVGMGCPNQELWMIENRPHLSAPILIGVGAAFNFITQTINQAPVFMQNNGLEWLFRLIQEPKRLWKRYFILNTSFIIKISQQILLDFKKNDQ